MKLPSLLKTRNRLANPPTYFHASKFGTLLAAKREESPRVRARRGLPGPFTTRFGLAAEDAGHGPGIPGALLGIVGHHTLLGIVRIASTCDGCFCVNPRSAGLHPKIRSASSERPRRWSAMAEMSLTPAILGESAPAMASRHFRAPLRDSSKFRRGNEK